MSCTAHLEAVVESIIHYARAGQRRAGIAGQGRAGIAGQGTAGIAGQGTAGIAGRRKSTASKYSHLKFLYRLF